MLQGNDALLDRILCDDLVDGDGALLSDEIRSAAEQARAYLLEQGYTEEKIITEIAVSIMRTAEETAGMVVESKKRRRDFVLRTKFSQAGCGGFR